MSRRQIFVTGGCLILAAGVRLTLHAEAPAFQAPAGAGPTPQAVLSKYCTSCHNNTRRTAGLALDGDLGDVAAHPEVWEKVIRKLRTEAMPPAGLPRPDKATYRSTAARLEQEIDRAAARRPDPGRLAPVHRLNRAEYQNAIRDLLALGSMDIELLLPPDDSSYGFDNIADALWISPSLLERYVRAAKNIGRQAIGDPDTPVLSETFRISEELAQDDRFESLPMGTRGGLVVERDFPVDGEYRFRIELTGTLRPPEPHDLEVAIDGRRVHAFAIGGKGARGPASDAGAVVETRVPVKGGRRTVAVAFVKKTSAEPEGLLQPFLRPVRGVIGQLPAVGAVTIAGPFGTTATSDTPSRRRIFTCRPKTAGDEPACAKAILQALTRRAYRRPVTDDDLEVLWPFYEAGRAEAGFDRGIQRAIERLLVSPSFLFRIEQDPAGSGTVAPTSDLELASRLSFFLWSSLPDEELLDLAIRGTLRQPGMLDRQVRRMLADDRSRALVTNFAGQWLYLRNVEAAAPDRLLFPDFDEGLRHAFRRETELLFESILDEGRSVLDLISADYTFVNERLARGHYGMPNVYGSHFRRVALGDSNRRGVLGHGSVLTVTSYSTRTSPVMRGKWILENLLGAPPPPPPPDVPTLITENGSATGRKLSMREAMVQHRANPQCASCHAAMDPLGFALENFDALGRWRTLSDGGEPIDASGALPSGAKFDGAAGLRAILVADPEPFVRTVVEKLLTYALGRGIEPTDQPAIRAISAAAARDRYSLASLVGGVVESVPFQMRKGTP